MGRDGTLDCLHKNDTCIKLGSDESHFNVSLIVRGKVTKTVSINHNFRRERSEESRSGIEPTSFCFTRPYRWAKPAHAGSLQFLVNQGRSCAVTAGEIMRGDCRETRAWCLQGR